MTQNAEYVREILACDGDARLLAIENSALWILAEKHSQEFWDIKVELSDATLINSSRTRNG